MSEENKNDNTKDVDILGAIKDGFNDIKESLQNVSRETSKPPENDNPNKPILDALNDIKDLLKKPESEESEELKAKIELPKIPEPEEKEEEKPEEEPKQKHWLERVIRG
jgi:hypothetical protein